MTVRSPRHRTVADRHILDEAGGLRAMTGILGIMVFLTMLAAALGLATGGAIGALDRQLSGRLTVQIVEADPARRDALSARAAAVLRAMPAVVRVSPVDRAVLARTLEPWLGADATDGVLPIPAMIDVDLAGDGTTAATVMRALRGLGPSVRVDRHADWMAPVAGVMRMITALAAALVVVMGGATVAVIILAARAGLETHRATIEVMHMLGATDAQVARIFQRRLGRDAGIGGAIGGSVAIGIIALIGAKLADAGPALLGGATLGVVGWAVLIVLPFIFVVLAMASARYAVLLRLARTL